MPKIKMRAYLVTFERVLDVRVYCPEGTPTKEIEEIACDVARSGDLDRHWDLPEWEAIVSRDLQDVRIEVNVKAPNKYGYRGLDSELLGSDDALALSDDRKEFVDPTDAKWIYTAVAGAASEADEPGPEAEEGEEE